jgi:hypothetical protein
MKAEGKGRGMSEEQKVGRGEFALPEDGELESEDDRITGLLGFNFEGRTFKVKWGEVRLVGQAGGKAKEDD